MRALDPRGVAVPLNHREELSGDGKLDCVPHTGSMVICQAEWEIMGILSINLVCGHILLVHRKNILTKQDWHYVFTILFI